MLRKIALFMLIIWASLITAKAQTITAERGRIPGGYNFWLSTPTPVSTNDSARYPIVVFLHGQSLSGNNLNKVLRYGTIAAQKKGLKLEGYVVAPQSSYGPWSPKKVMDVVDWVIAHENNVDTTRIYVIGMSKGGYGAIDVAAAYPDRIAAAAAFCGGATVKQPGEALSRVPLWIVHGTADRAVSVKESDRVVSEIKEADADAPRLVYDRVPGMNHGKPARLFYMPEMYEWLFAHTLNDPGRAVAKTFAITTETLAKAYRSCGSRTVKLGPPATADAIPPEPAAPTSSETH